MKGIDPYQILKIEFDGINEAIRKYTGDSLVNNYLNKMNTSLQGDNTSQVMYYLEKLCAWYSENLSKIYTNEYVYNKREHEKSKQLLDELFVQLKDYDFSQIKQKIPEILSSQEKQPRIFISHSSKDKLYVELLVILFDSMGLNTKQVFCSSLPGYDIPIDTDIFEYLREQFLQYNLHVIFIHSDNYYKSSVSLNEMGAAWALKSNYTSFLLPKFDFGEMSGVVNSKTVAIKLDNSESEIKDKLNQLYTKLIDEFSLTEKPPIIWEKNRDTFISSVISKSKKQSELTKVEISKRKLF